MMDDDAVRGVHNFEPFCACPKTEVQVFKSIDEGFVECAEGKKEFAWNEHACGSDSLKFSGLIDGRMRGAEVSVYMVYFYGAERYSCMLDCVVWVEEFAADYTDISVAYGACHQ